MSSLRISGIASKHFSTSSADRLVLADISLAYLENLRIKSASPLRSQNSAKHRLDYSKFSQIFSLGHIKKYPALQTIRRMEKGQNQR